MTPEELLKPRYKVVAEYPNMPFTINQVLSLTIRLHGQCSYEWYEYDGLYEIWESELKDYPHLFKKLEWWHERSEEDLPKYIGAKNEHDVFNWVHPISKWEETRLNEQGCCVISFTNLDGLYEEIGISPWSLTPATKEEYEQFINQNK